MSPGAKEADLRVQWGFGNAINVITSYNLNFFNGPDEHIKAAAFACTETDVKIDVVHLSPRCVLYSTATKLWKKGENHAKHKATLKIIPSLINKVKPYCDIRNVAGIPRQNPDTMAPLVSWFTDLGFNIRWGIFNLGVFSIPHSQEMPVMIIASW